jgi:hypothetical protein
MRLPSDLKRMEALHSFTFAPWNHNPVQWKSTASLLLPVGYFHFLTKSRQAGHDGDKMRSATWNEILCELMYTMGGLRTKLSSNPGHRPAGGSLDLRLLLKKNGRDKQLGEFLVV